MENPNEKMELIEMQNQVIEMRNQTTELGKQTKYAKRALIISLIALIISLLSVIAPIAYEYIVKDRIVVPAFSLLFSSAIADEMDSITVEDSKNDVMRTTFTIFEANGKLDCFTHNNHIFYITNNNPVAIAVSDIYFRVKEYYPITDFFNLYWDEGWGDQHHNIYKFDIGAGTRKTYHGKKCDSNRQPMEDVFTRIDAGSIESFAIEYNFSAQGVYYGDLVFVFEINNKQVEQIITNSTTESSLSKIVYLPEADDWMENPSPKFLEFDPNEEGEAYEADGFSYVNDTFSNAEHIKQHLMKYYPNHEAYYQCVLDHYVPFLKNSEYAWDLISNSYVE